MTINYVTSLSFTLESSIMPTVVKYASRFVNWAPRVVNCTPTVVKYASRVVNYALELLIMF
jgi:hypothetical protein